MIRRSMKHARSARHSPCAHTRSTGIAPNERHWHGATSGTPMSHTTTTIGATEFDQAVTEAEYAAANGTPRDWHATAMS